MFGLLQNGSGAGLAALDRELPPVDPAAIQWEVGGWTDGGPQQTSMNVMRSCTLMEVRRCVRRVVTCAERNTDTRSEPEKNPSRRNVSEVLAIAIAVKDLDVVSLPLAMRDHAQPK